MEKQGAKIFYGPHKAANLDSSVDLVVHTSAATPKNPELKKAKKLGIKIQTYSQALGDLTKKMFTIAVSGMHGKSTTTAMLALVLEKAGFDPTVIVGTKLREWGNLNYRVGNPSTRLRARSYLVIEADEYKAAFLNYRPKILVLTNIEEEHLDYYKDLKHIINVFKKYISRLGKKGILVANGDNANILKIKMQKSKSQFKIQNYSTRQQETGKIRQILKVPGDHNVSNALAVLVVARELKISDKITFKTLSDFSGTWRRMEYRGKINGAQIYDDYGHHLTEIKATLEGAREFLQISPFFKWGQRGISKKNPPRPSFQTGFACNSFGINEKGGRRLYCVFQPHQYQRTYKLFNQFTNAFDFADKTIILPIYSVAGREKENVKRKVNSEMLVKAITRRKQLTVNRKQEVSYLDSFQKAKNYLKKNLKKGDVCVIMGAGDVYKLTEMLLKR